MSKKQKAQLPVIGWREWVKLPDLGVENIKAKVDSGARSSSIHAANLKLFDREGEKWVRFKVYPIQRSHKGVVDVEAKIFDFRSVRSSSGVAKVRPVILTKVGLLGSIWEVELTLASRDNMGFRMLLGREAFRKRFLVDGGKSYYGGKPLKTKRKAPRSKKF